MNRREAITILGGLPVALKTAIAAPLGYGLVDVDTHFDLRRKGVWLRAIFNGVDVNDRCREADDKTGRVRLFLHDANGMCYLSNGGELAEETLYGQVSFVRAAPWA